MKTVWYVSDFRDVYPVKFIKKCGGKVYYYDPSFYVNPCILGRKCSTSHRNIYNDEISANAATSYFTLA